MVTDDEAQWSQNELAEHWTLLPDELKLLANKTGPTRLGFSLLLKAFAYQGRFPRHMQELPATVVVHVARQVGVPAELYPSYEWSGSHDQVSPRPDPGVPRLPRGDRSR